MIRALTEFRIRGVKTNIPFLQNILGNDTFKKGAVTVNFIANEPELFQFKKPRNRATKLVTYLADVIVNGNSNVPKNTIKKSFVKPIVPSFHPKEKYPEGTKDLLTKLGPDEFSKWLKAEKKVHFTDTTMRDAHQSLLATRMRSFDMLNVAEGYAKNHPEIFSMEVWGGATFDVCMRFLQEDPWERLQKLRTAMPNVLLQMLLRGSNGVGYKAYPDNLIELFVEKSWENGVDVFRIFDSLNWMESIAPCIGYVRNKTKGLAEGSICYTNDILNPKNKKYTLTYYLQLAKQIEDAGAHILGIKDMAGLLKPYAAQELILALKAEIKIPIHLHTHDTSSIQSATYLKAIEAGVDVVDVALGGLSGLTSQPNFNSIVEMMRFTARENTINASKLNEYSNYWEAVRDYYFPFESGLKSGSGEVYTHEIPGGQYSNLKPQAKALGLEDKFHEITKMYAEVNQLFGDIVKVTPSSKVVGDMAQYLVSNGFSIADVLEKGETMSFPASVVSLFMGNLGQPVEGFPERIQQIVLKDKKPYTTRPNAHLEAIDIAEDFKEFTRIFKDDLDKELEITDYLSYKLYPKVYTDKYNNYLKYNNLINLPTENFFYGMNLGEEIIVELARGKKLLIQLVSIGKPNNLGMVTVFFKVNGQSRLVEIKDEAISVKKIEHLKAEKDDTLQIGATLQGLLSEVLVKKGDQIKANQPLFIIEAMKMETTITALNDALVNEVVLKAGTMVNSLDLIVRLEKLIN
jgi:pyruvate carboxylase